MLANKSKPLNRDSAEFRMDLSQVSLPPDAEIKIDEADEESKAFVNKYFANEMSREGRNNSITAEMIESRKKRMTTIEMAKERLKK